MSLLVACPYCQTQYNLPQKFQGKKVKCKSCGKPFSATVAAARVKTGSTAATATTQGQDVDPQQLANMGIGAIKQNVDPFAAAPHHGPDPLRNHVVQDPGFGMPGMTGPAAVAGGNPQEVDPDYQAVVSNPYIKAPKPSKAHGAVEEDEEPVSGKKGKKRKNKTHPAVKESLDKATMTLLIIGVLICMLCGFFFISAYGDSLTEIKNVNKFSVNAGGEGMTDAEMEEWATEEAYAKRVVWGIGIFLGVIYMILGVGVQIFPITCSIISLVFYILFELFVCIFLFDFVRLGGWIRRFVVIGALGKAFMDALNARYYNQMMAERRAAGK